MQIRSFGSPQLFAGSDVMNRVSYDAGEFRGELHDAMAEGRRLLLAYQATYAP